MKGSNHAQPLTCAPQYAFHQRGLQGMPIASPQRAWRRRGSASHSGNQRNCILSYILHFTQKSAPIPCARTDIHSSTAIKSLDTISTSGYTPWQQRQIHWPQESGRYWSTLPSCDWKIFRASCRLTKECNPLTCKSRDESRWWSEMWSEKASSIDIATWSMDGLSSWLKISGITAYSLPRGDDARNLLR